jgi:hypothetical protein
MHLRVGMDTAEKQSSVTKINVYIIVNSIEFSTGNY